MVEKLTQFLVLPTSAAEGEACYRFTLYLTLSCNSSFVDCSWGYILGDSRQNVPANTIPPSERTPPKQNSNTMTTISIPTTMKAFVVNDELTQRQPLDNDERRNPLLDNGTLQINYPVPTIPSPSYALLQILRAGICNTDLEILQGYMGFKGILGHEFVGRVVALHEQAQEDAKEMWLGKRVCGDINLGCCNNTDFISSSSSTLTTATSCPASLCGICTDSLGYNSTNPQMARNHCPNRTVLGILNQHGSFCEYMILPIQNLHVVPPNMKNEVAVFAEPLAAACRIVEQGLVNFRYHDKGDEDNDKAKISRAGDRVAILGDGKLGLCVAEILGREYLRCWKSTKITSRPSPPILFGKHTHKLELVQDSGVQTHLVSTSINENYNSNSSSSSNQTSQRVEISPNYRNKFDVVIDATGNPNGLDLAMSLCRPMGKLILKSTCAAGVQGFHSAPIVIDELMVVGSRCGPIDVALDVMNKSGDTDNDNDDNVGIPSLNMEKYITKSFPLSRVREALECAALKSTLKVQLVMTDDE